MCFLTFVLLVVICFPPFVFCKTVDIVTVSHFNILIVHICVHAVKVLSPISVTSCKPLYTSSRTSQIFKFSSLEHNRGICKTLCESVQAFNFKCVCIVLLMGFGFLCLEKHDK